MKSTIIRYLKNFKAKRIHVLVFIVITGLVFLRQNNLLFSEKNIEETEGVSVVTIENVNKIFPEAKNFIPSKSQAGLYGVIDYKGQAAGNIIDTRSYTKHIKGYGGQVPFLIGIDAAGKVKGLCLLDNYESPSFIDRVKKSTLLDSWNNLNLEETISYEVDTVTGATITSRAIIDSLKETAPHFCQSADICKTSEAGNKNKIIFSVFVLMFALASFLKPAIMNRYRTILLVLNIVILGFWSGQFLSISLFISWMRGALFSGGYLLLIMIVVTIFTALFTNKNIYCTYLCPYGSFQELVGKAIGKKKTIPKNIENKLKILRRIFLSLIVILAFTGIRFDFSLIEPFSAFLINSAHLIVIVIAIIFLIASIFKERFWCRYLCPTGQVLDVFSKKN